MTNQPMAIMYTTVGTLAQAKSLAHQAVEAKVAFCVNIMPMGVSIYRWEGEIHEESECYLLLKTTKEMQETLLAWLADHHPYAIPVIINADVMVNSSYLISMANKQIR